MDPISFVNFFFCVIISILGVVIYWKKKDVLPLYIGAAFAIFALTHLLTLLSFREPMTNIFIIIRIIAYLLVIFAFYKFLQ